MSCLRILMGNAWNECGCCADGREVEWVDLAEFLPRVRLIARGVPDEVALEFLNASAVRFTQSSGVLKRRASVNIQAGVRDYFIEAGKYEQISRMELSENHDWTFYPPDKLVLRETPIADVHDGLCFEYVAMPKQVTCKVDKLLFEHYQDGIVSGALAELLLLRQYGFADPAIAGHYERSFLRMVHRAKIDVARDFDNRMKGFGLAI